MKMGIVEFIFVGLRAGRAADKCKTNDRCNNEHSLRALYQAFFHRDEMIGRFPTVRQGQRTLTGVSTSLRRLFAKILSNECNGDISPTEWGYPPTLSDPAL